MSDLDINEFKKALTDVRKAYRLLYHYQRRVMDTVQFISDQTVFSFHGGWSWFSNPMPKNKSVKLAHWAWDWLNMYFYDFHLGERVVDGVTYSLSVILQSDTGFFDSQINDKRNVEAFAPVEESETRMILCLGVNHWDPTSLLNEKAIHRGETMFYKEYNEKGSMMAKAYNLTAFMNEESILSTLEDFKTYCRDMGVIELFKETSLKTHTREIQ